MLYFIRNKYSTNFKNLKFMKKNGLGDIGKRFLIKISDVNKTTNPAFQEKEKDIMPDYAIVTREDKDRLNLLVLSVAEQKSYYLTVWRKNQQVINNNTVKKVEFLTEFKEQKDFLIHFCLLWHKIPSKMKTEFVNMSKMKFTENIKQTSGIPLGHVPRLTIEKLAAVA